MRKSKVLQEIANGFPEWTKIRSDDQSIGKSLLNVYALEAEDLFTESNRVFKNTHLTTTNCLEIDQLEILSIPDSFPFTLVNEGSLSEAAVEGTVSGVLDSTYVEVQNITSNSVKDFWYQSLPTRVTLEESFLNSGVLSSGLASEIDLTLNFNTLAISNQLVIKVSGEKLVDVVNNKIQKARVRVTGVSWKGIEETEDIVFLYSESKKSFKSWTSISSIQAIDFPEDATITVNVLEFNQDFLLDTFGELSQFTYKRENFPLFWSLGASETNNSTLIANSYTAKRAIELLKHQPQFEALQAWELVDADNNELDIVDIACVPYQQKIAAITMSGLYFFDTHFELPDLQELNLKTSNALIDIETTSDYLIRGEEVEIMALFQKPIKTIVKHRIKIKYPDEQELGILEDGTLVSTSTDYFVNDERIDRFIRQPFILELSDFGQHLITLEVTYLDGSIEIAQRAVLVLKKNALAYLDLSSITSTASGIDYDHLNQLIIKDETSLRQLNLFYDYCLWDIQNRELILREKYNQVKIYP